LPAGGLGRQRALVVWPSAGVSAAPVRRRETGRPNTAWRHDLQIVILCGGRTPGRWCPCGVRWA